MPENETLPEARLQTFSSLECEIVADFPLTLSTVETRWIVPDGRTIENARPMDQYILTQGLVRDSYKTILLVQNLMYTDANIYTCEARDTHNSSPEPWIPAQVHLQLKGNDVQ